jgi:hypothetical protein
VDEFQPLMSQPENSNLYENKITAQSIGGGNSSMAKRLLDLDNIKTSSLQILSPTEKEIDPLKIDSEKALADYANRLREG